MKTTCAICGIPVFDSAEAIVVHDTGLCDDCYLEQYYVEDCDAGELLARFCEEVDNAR